MSDCVVVKLVNGEILIGERLHESYDTLIINRPVAIKTIQMTTPGGLVEKTVTAPFCSLSSDEEFALDKRHVIYVSTLHDSVVPLYFNMTESFGEEFQSFTDNLSTGEYEQQEDQYYEEDQEDSTVVIPETKTIH